ncbi:thiamine phosphate synthase [Flavobacterium sp. TAB 87]|uniref:thiamine phosphate synthase n=1 Tax=Flavobacterium sp. TAB 87 TaxID=1729581 RepID=UPI00076D3DD1|nr:thiamine phosphate synthase [Flavobacterium sp. TAB 87]KVV14543.1 Thiamine-phosphate synthase [Flavobacterium sp. TAB 87]
MFNKLQYISQGENCEKQLQNIRLALDSGCEWIQLRFKNQTDTDSFKIAKAVKILCEEHEAKLIINDNVALAKQIDADGVHLGLADMRIKDARFILGEYKIIGGTANTIQDIKSHIQNGCDYIGLGPFKFTKTKERLAPILGLNGYHNIIQDMKNQVLKIPIYAIGGITLDDVDVLMQTGIHGIAVSGLLTDSQKPKELITQLNEKLYDNVII